MALTVLAYQFVLSLLVPAFQETTRDNLLVYGEGFSFFVKEPNQWMGDIENAMNM